MLFYGLFVSLCCFLIIMCGCCSLTCVTQSHLIKSALTLCAWLPLPVRHGLGVCLGWALFLITGTVPMELSALPHTVGLRSTLLLTPGACRTRVILAPPESTGKQNHQGKDLQATQYHGKSKCPLGRVVKVDITGTHTCQPRAEIVHTGGDR